VFGASVLVALMPWNVALWIQARRLRLGIEMDCDMRVLRAHPSPERYGMLILPLAQRKSLAPALFAPMLSEPKTTLEQRIRAMRTTKVARATAVGGALVTLSVLALASSLQSAPTSFAETRAAIAQKFVAGLPSAFAPETIPVTSRKPATTAAPTSAPATQLAPGAQSKQEVRKLGTVVVSALNNGEFQNPAPRYPALLRAAEVEGAVVARFNYDDRGAVDANSIAIITSTNARMSDAVTEALKSWHGTPKTSAQVPFVFVLSTKTGKDLAAYPGGLPAGSVVVNAPPLSDADVQRVLLAGTGEPKPVDANATFFEFQVEQPVTAVPGNRGPRYPDELRKSGVEGEVLAQFIVDNDGHADMNSFKVLKSNHDLFTAAVMSVLPDMKFKAAQVGGRAVKQLVQMPFQFNLSKQ